MPARIITDSGLDVPEACYERLTVLPLGITFGTKTYADGVDLTNERFYELLIEGDELPKTSQVTPFAYGQVFERVRAAGEEAVVITLSSKLSGTHQSAVTAAADYPEIHVVDGKNVTIGQGVLVLYALRLADEGLSAAQIAAQLEEARERVCVVGLLDTLEYLKRGGRISAVTAAFGSLLGIKPLLTVQPDGTLASVGKIKGSKKVYSEFIRLMHELNCDYSKYAIEVVHADCEEFCNGFVEALKKEFGDDINVHTQMVGPVIGSHCGPGTLGVIFYKA